MPVLKFRIYWEEEESIYRDILILSGQSFLHLHQAILQAFDFDQKHQASFFRSNDQWQRGREMVLEKRDEKQQTEPLIMGDTIIANTIRNPNQKFVYLYDYQRQWIFLVELIGVNREEDRKKEYPLCVRKEGPAPSQYSNKNPVKDQIMESEEKYDLNNEDPDAGYGEEGEDPDHDSEMNASEDFY